MFETLKKLFSNTHVALNISKNAYFSTISVCQSYQRDNFFKYEISRRLRVFGIFLIIITVEKMRYLAVFLVGNDSIQVYVLDAAENIRLDLRVALL